MLSNLVNVQYCYDYLIGQIPVGLLLYSHIPTALVALVFGLFVFFSTRKLASLNLLIVALFFALWCFVDISSWFSFLGSDITMFSWSLADLFSLIFFFFSYYFLYTFTTNKDLPVWQKLVGLLVLLPTTIWTFLGMNLPAYDADACEAVENGAVTGYLFYIEGFILLAVIALTIVQFRKLKDKHQKREVLLAGIGVSIFLAVFLSATILASILVNYESTAEYAYNFEIYGLFGMPVLLIYLGYLIVRYKAFDLRIFGAQALVFALLAVLASEFAFVTTTTNRLLVAITLVLTAMVGIVLIRSVRREIEQRERIELLARDLDVANKQQTALIRFISHQLKGFVGKARIIFSEIKDGTYGPTPDTMKPLIEEGYNSATKGAQTIQDILNASNIKSGKMAYQMQSFDFKVLVENVVSSLKSSADAKGVALTLEAPSEPIMFTGDRMQLENAIKNIVDNTIKYTPQGSIKITLTNDGKLIRFTTEDTGVGITAEDMQHLFTEGGHGVESQKVNVDSTGFGLYIVKNIVEAHKGKVWAESEGAGKGSRFIVEIPASAA